MSDLSQPSSGSTSSTTTPVSIQGTPSVQSIAVDQAGNVGRNALCGNGGRQVSAANATNQLVLTEANLHDILAIYVTCSAGTASLLVEVSEDNANWITIDNIAAAATQVKQYSVAHNDVGAGIALSPLAFMFVRITVGAAGVGNTTTLLVGMK